MPWTPRRLRHDRRPRRLLTSSLGAIIAISAVLAPTPAAAAGPTPPPPSVDGPIKPSIHYEDVLRHADDELSFTPGGRVTVGFTPRNGDRFLIGGEAPRALPAGRLSGRAIREASLGKDPADAPAVDPPTVEPTDEPAPPTEPTPTATLAPVPSDSSSPSLPPDGPIIDPSTAIPAIESSVHAPATPGAEDVIDPTAVVSASGLRKEVFGFLPYWELDSGTVLDYSKLSTIAFFGVGASAAGNLEKTSGGSTTVGWSGWTSSRMTTLINDAHRNKTRVVLTIQSFGWSSAGLTKQKTLLGSSTARANLARQIAAAIRDRGADGVNLDFEPLASGYEDEFVSLVRRVRTELDAVKKGYQLTFDTLGYIGNYPVAAATAAGGADAIFIMGYDYRNSSSSTVGSIAPIGGPAYDIRDTIAAYTAKVSASKLILGVPYYGRAWSTDTNQLNAKNISGTKNGASASVTYKNAVGYLSDHGRRYDTVEGVAWTVYRRENCTATYGCVTPWRQLYVDDAQALKSKYDLVNQNGLRGIGIWALGYDGTRTELWTAIRDKFITDKTPPRAGIKVLAPTQGTEQFPVSWASNDDFGVVSHDVEVSTDGGSWARWLSATTATSRTFTGARGHAFAFRVRARDGKGNLSAWDTIPKSNVSAKVAVGGFGRVATGTLNARSAAGTGNTIIDTLDSGDVVAFLQGPVSANGYVWYRVAAPLTEWSVVGTTRTDLWVAVSGDTSPYVTAVVPPNSTKASSSATLIPTASTSWHGVDPVRLLDTRIGNGLSGKFIDDKVRSVTLAGRGGIPADAIAVTANLTITGASSAGYVSIGPTMTAKPSTSSINFTKGQTLANGLTLKLGSGGTASAVLKGASGSSVHMILDVTGYYRDDSGATWHPLAPTRLLDTRFANGLSGSFVSRTVRSFQVGGRGSVPTDAIAVTGNLTATGATASGYVALGPSMTSSPSTSTLNLGKGKTVANNVAVRLGSGDKLSAVYVASAGARVHLVFDVTGYYRAGSGGASWYAIDPVRLLDTRVSNGLSGRFKHGVVRTVQVASRGTIPVDAVALTGNLTVTGPTSAGYMSIGPSMSSTPSTSTINFAKSQTIANGVALRLATGGKAGAVFKGSSGATTHAILDATGYFR